MLLVVTGCRKFSERPGLPRGEGSVDRRYLLGAWSEPEEQHFATPSQGDAWRFVSLATRTEQGAAPTTLWPEVVATRATQCCCAPVNCHRKMVCVIRAVVFDVGETLVDETREYGTWADWLGVPRHTFSSVLPARIQSS
jgi:hypothetical protein